jgi:hypothetical protein
MNERQRGGWVYVMADRYRGTIYVGVTSNLAARIYQHRNGDGSDFCRRYEAGVTKTGDAPRFRRPQGVESRQPLVDRPAANSRPIAATSPPVNGRS